MSDPHYDAMREAGTYPPKGFGYFSTLEQVRQCLNYWKHGVDYPWIVEELLGRFNTEEIDEFRADYGLPAIDWEAMCCKNS